MGWFARAARLKSLPVALWPVLLGVVAGGAEGGRLAVRAGAAAAAAALAHVAMHLGTEIQDARWGAGKIARMERSSIATATGEIDSGAVARATAAATWGASIAASALLWLVVGDDAPVVGGTTLALIVVGALVSRTREFAFALATAGWFVAGYDAFGGSIALAFAPAFVPFAFALALFVTFGILQWRADLAVKHPTLAAILQPDRGLLLAGTALIAAYVAVVVNVLLERFPAVALVALVTAIGPARALGRAIRDPAPQHVLRLLGATLGGSVLTGLLLMAAAAS